MHLDTQFYKHKGRQFLLKTDHFDCFQHTFFIWFGVFFLMLLKIPPGKASFKEVYL